jgi:hypothetical protein
MGRGVEAWGRPVKAWEAWEKHARDDGKDAQMLEGVRGKGTLVDG